VGDENRRGLGNQALFDREDAYCREEAVLDQSSFKRKEDKIEG